jgi:hypothetical protein
MLLLPRLWSYGLGIYVFYLIAYPDWKSSPYHLIALTLIFLAAIGVYVTFRVLRLGTAVGTFLFDIAFATSVLLGVGWTMPQRSGKVPVQLFVEGVRPNRERAEEGLERLQIDPTTRRARLFLKLFPK